MKKIILSIVCFLFFQLHVFSEEKCTWNILKSNCKTKAISKILGDKGSSIMKKSTDTLKKNSGKIGDNLKKGTDKVKDTIKR
jgi:hypothetical protein